MGFGERTLCQIMKSSAENRWLLVHNAEATEEEGKTHHMTDYVNICNLSTPDIVGKTQKPINILWMVNIRKQIKLCQKLDKKRKNR